jgi:hypothetical protein
MTVQPAMVTPAQRHGELIADLAAQRPVWAKRK